MAIIINIDVMLAKRKMSVTELAEKVGITMANISILKNGKAKAIWYNRAMKNTNTKKILITVAIQAAVAIILYFAFPSLTGRSVAPAEGVDVTAETITDSEWGFSFPNTTPALTLVAYGSDNPCNDTYCRELSNGLMYTVTDISAGLATKPESFRSNANKLPIY